LNKYFFGKIRSAGCVVYEMLTLQKAFVGENFEEVKKNIMNINIPDSVNNGVFQNILNKLESFEIKNYILFKRK